MNAKNRNRLFLTACLLICCPFGLAAVANPKITGTFSSFEYHRKSGDLTGIEIRLIPVGSGMKGLVQFAEGGAGELLLVDIVNNGDKVSFTSPPNYKSLTKFDGVVSRSGLSGTFVYSGGSVEKVFLKRTQSYWDR